MSGAVARATASTFLMPLLALPDCHPVIRTGDSVDLVRGLRGAIVPRAIVREHVAAGRLEVIARFEPSQSGVHAVFQAGSVTDLARRAVDVLIEHVRAQSE